MSIINKAAVLNPFTDLADDVFKYTPRATPTEYGVVALGSGVSLDDLGRIRFDTQEFLDRFTVIEAQAASTLDTQQTEVAAAIAQVNLTQSQTITTLTLEVDNLRTELTNSITATQTDLINRADQLAQNVADTTEQLTQDNATLTQEIKGALDSAKRGISNRYDNSLTYGSGDRVVLENGDIVKSTVDGNVNNPNVDMTGWVKAGNLIIINTVAEMLSKALKNGDVVKTLSYHNISDDGGAVYLISSTATDYSIPLENGLHAIFRDTFDTRKFGIRDSKTLDQTAELQRMIAYADSRFYEIDFHGFNIRKPNILQMGQGGIPINGMIFNYAHRLKNLKPCNDKTSVLQQDSSCIAFMPKHNPETIEVFELNNVVFNPYVANYNIIAEYYDGNMHGFIAHPHIDSTDLIAWGTQPANFGFRFKDIKSISPAISYNITTAAVFAQFIETDNISGEYIGCYINNHSVRHNFKNTHGVYRDDLHNPSRLLVTSLIHHEPELAGGSIDIQGFNLDNISCIKHSDQTNHLSFQLHALGTITIDEVQANNVSGHFEFYAVTGNDTKVKTLSVSNSHQIIPGFAISIDKTLFDNTPVNDLLFRNGTKRYITCELKDSVVNAGIIYDDCTLDELFLDRVTITNPIYGLVRAEAYIKEININDIRVSGGRFVFCKFDQIKGNGLTIIDTPTVAGEFLQAITNTAPSAVKITGVKALVSTPGYFINKYAGHILNADIRFSEFLVMPAFNVDTLHYELNSPPNTYNTPFYPPAIAVGASVTKEIAVAGAKVGDPVSAAFTQYNPDVSVSAIVSAVDTVLVTFKNNGASPVTISGSINLRI